MDAGDRNGELEGLRRRVAELEREAESLRASEASLRAEAQEARQSRMLLQEITERKREEEERAALQDKLIAAQRMALRELSTPLIPIAEDVVIMPLVGTIDSVRAWQLMETLLQGVTSHRASAVIIDMTGVEVVDTHVASSLVRASKAVRLLGAEVVLTGIRPEVARTLAGMGADLSSIVVHGSLRSGIAHALRRASSDR